ncbi:MAG: tetratricopeptide repeat protein, partial [Prolixibacteraceae bacterium]|nr:tetratricopeptide repeat protein [Prolixibacteraceae bacterium]
MQKVAKRLILLCLMSMISIVTVNGQTKAEKLFFKGDYAEALVHLEEKISDNKALVSDYQMAAACYLQQFNVSGAIQCYRKGLSIFPGAAELDEGLSDALLNLGNKEEALAGYERLFSTDSTNIRIKGKLAGVLTDMNRFREAVVHYQDLYTADSANVYFMRKLMQVRYKLQDYHLVIAMAENNPFFPVQNKELLMLIADSHTRINQNPEAIDVLTSILQQDSLYLPALNKLGFIHFGTYRNYEDAVPLYRMVNHLEAYSDPFHLKNLAICEYFTGNQEYAAPVLDSLIKELENDPFVPFYAGLSYQKLGEADKALDRLKKAADMVIPAFASDVFHHLGRAYGAKRMFEEALAVYQRVRDLDPTNYQVLYDIAITYEEWNLNRTMALGFYQQFVKECTNPRSVDLRYAENR